MTTMDVLEGSWEWYPSVVIGCALLAAGYLAVVRPLQRARSAAFLGGAVLLLLTLVGPLDGLGDEYLFSAHMLEHLILLVVVPPLFLLGLTPETVGRLLRWPPAAAAERVLGRPVIAWLLAVVALYAWHVPALYNAALADERIHVAEHMTFLVTATIFWWPVLGPVGAHRMRGHAAILYLFLAAVANSVLGAILTFSGPGYYPLYDRPENGSAEMRLIREGWGLGPAADQQLGGLFMWVVGGFFFLIAVLGMYARWYRESGREGTP